MKKLILLSVILLAIVVLSVIGKKSITTGIIINAPAHRVWDEFADFGRYPEWNPFIRKLSGEIKTGGVIEVIFQTRGDEPVVFTPVIQILEKDKTFQWEGKLFIPGIFTGKHTFQLIDLGNNKTELVQKEDFNGILVPFFNFNTTIEGFEEMNRALKKRVEKN